MSAMGWKDLTSLPTDELRVLHLLGDWADSRTSYDIAGFLHFSQLKKIFDLKPAADSLVDRGLLVRVDIEGAGIGVYKHTSKSLATVRKYGESIRRYLHACR